MTVALEIPSITYLAVGAVTSFAYPFRVLLASDLVVTLNGDPATGYSLTGVGIAGGGNVVFSAAPTGTLVIERHMPLKRDTAFQTLGDFQAGDANTDWDRTVMMLQEQAAGTARTLRAPAGESINALPPAATRANKIQAYDSLGQPVTLVGVDSGSAAALDLSLRSAVASASGAGQTGYANLAYSAATVGRALKDRGVSATDAPYSAQADFGVTSAAINNAAIQLALNAFGANGGTLLIPKGVKWGPYSSVTHPDEVTIHDLSGWDWKYSQWTGQVKYLMKTATPGSKNANEFQLIGQWNPALVIDNVNPGTPDWHASIVWRLQGVSDWQLSPDVPTSPGTQRTFLLNFYGTYAGVSYPGGTHILGIDPYDGTWGFNSAAVTGFDRFFQGLRSATFLTRDAALLANGFERQWVNGTNGLLRKHRISGADGADSLVTGAVFSAFHTAAGEVFGNREKVTTKAAGYSITDNTADPPDVGVAFTNSSASGIVFALPVATPGLVYEGCVTVGGMTFTPSTGQKFRAKAANASYVSTTLGSIIRMKCYVAGIWDTPLLQSGWA